MQKNILCFGDSNTWGYIPGTGERYAPEVRWPGGLRTLSVQAVYPEGFAVSVREGAEVKVADIASGAIYSTETDSYGISNQADDCREHGFETQSDENGSWNGHCCSESCHTF